MSEGPGSSEPVRRPAGSGETRRANRTWWDDAAPEYQVEHGAFLGDADFVWGPEGWREAELHLLGDIAGRTVLEIGCGAAQCARWLQAQGARSVGVDLSGAQLRESRRLDDHTAGVTSAAGAAPADAGARSVAGAPSPGDDTRHRARIVPLVQADALALPFADASIDVACSAYGAVPFVADSAAVMHEAARVLRPGGLWVFSVSHPLRWALPDDPGPAGLTVRSSYFDRTPYVEQDQRGAATYAEHHRTLGDRIREIVTAGLIVEDVVEPEWPERNPHTWGGWSPLRGRLIPGTAIFCTRKP